MTSVHPCVLCSSRHDDTPNRAAPGRLACHRCALNGAAWLDNLIAA